jgi:predicted nucleic acid-binding protein
VIFVASNIPMYLVGAAHPHKVDAQRLLERCIADAERLVTDAEVLEEVLQRCHRTTGRDPAGVRRDPRGGG